MIKQAYFRGLMKVAQAAKKQMSQQEKDRMLVFPSTQGKIWTSDLANHGFYKDVPGVERFTKKDIQVYPDTIRVLQAYRSANKFAPGGSDPIRHKLKDYYQSIGRQNRDFYLKQGFRPPKDHKYKTPFPYPNHPKKKQMMNQNQYQVRNTRGAQDYSIYT